MKCRKTTAPFFFGFDLKVQDATNLSWKKNNQQIPKKVSLKKGNPAKSGNIIYHFPRHPNTC